MDYEETYFPSYSRPWHHVVVSVNRETPCSPQKRIIRIMRTPKKVRLILGNSKNLYSLNRISTPIQPLLPQVFLGNSNLL